VNPNEQKNRLKEAEAKAARLFSQIEARGLIRAGISEEQLNDVIFDLAFELFGIEKYWHKRIVRAGPNTLQPYRENPPNLLIQASDILFFDFGPVFEEWEADFGRTYVLGDDPARWRIKHDIEEAWYLGQAHFDAHPDITGAELYRFILELTAAKGWEYPQHHCGHLIGHFPHEDLHGANPHDYIHPDNHTPMRDCAADGNPRDWILEIHFVDRALQIGGFFEQLL
jgi:Xaa-Pro aminopeptidase